MANPSYLNLPAIWNYGPTQSPPTTSDNAPVGAGKVAATQALMNSTATAMQAVFPSGDTTGATDTAAIQAALTQISNDTTGNQRTLMLFGTYYVNATLVLTMANNTVGEGPFTLLGSGSTIINAVGSNFGILQIKTTTTTCHGPVIRGITFTYLTPQPASNTASVCVGFSTVAGNDNGVIYQIEISSCFFVNYFRAIANVQTSGSYLTWGIWIANNYGYGGSGSFVYLVSPTAGGQPRINIINNYVDMAPNYGTSTAAEPVFHIGNGDSLVVMGNELNGIYQATGFYLTQCTFTMTRNKIEECNFNGTTYPIFLNQSTGSVDGFNLLSLIVATNQYIVNCIGLYTAECIRLAGFNTSIASGASTLTLINVSISRVVLQDVPTIYTLGTGPAVFRLVYSSVSTNSRLIDWAAPPAGMMSADNGDTSITPNPLTSAQVQIFNTPLTANRTVTLSAANGSTTADNCLDNTTFTILRTANSNDSNTLTVTAIVPATKTVATGTSVTYIYNEPLGGFVEIAAGAL
jgi:hypothetical protein